MKLQTCFAGCRGTLRCADMVFPYVIHSAARQQVRLAAATQSVVSTGLWNSSTNLNAGVHEVHVLPADSTGATLSVSTPQVRHHAGGAGGRPRANLHVDLPLCAALHSPGPGQAVVLSQACFGPVVLLDSVLSSMLLILVVDTLRPAGA